MLLAYLQNEESDTNFLNLKAYFDNRQVDLLLSLDPTEAVSDREGYEYKQERLQQICRLYEDNWDILQEHDFDFEMIKEKAWR